MKLTIIASLLFQLSVYSQIGIGTESPTRALDVNGNLRIRTSSTISRETSAKDSILVVDASGNVDRISSKIVVESHFKTFIKGGFSTTSPSLLTLNILSFGYVLIPFKSIEFDTNNEFSTDTSIFTAKQAGIYSVSVSIRASPSAVTLGTDLGVGICKNDVLQVKNNFANISVALIGNVTPPVRTVQTLLKLNQNDTISFKVYSAALLSVGLLTSGEESFFTIHQVR